MSSSTKILIACRVCDRVFLDSMALINHIESHLVDEESAARVRKQIQISHLITSSQNLNPFSNPQIQPSHVTAALPVQPLPQFQPCFRNNNKQFYPPVPVPPSPPFPSVKRNSFDVLPNPNPSPNPYLNPNHYPSAMAYNYSPTRDLNAGVRSGFEKHSSVPFPKQRTQRLGVMEDPSDHSRPFLSLLDYPIPSRMNNNCNGNSDDNQLDLTLKL